MQTIPVKYHGTGDVFKVSEGTSLSQMQNKMPMFFKTPHGKRETYSVYRGQLIVRKTVQFTHSPPERKTVVYIVYIDDNGDLDTFHIGESANVRQAKKLIDKVLESGEC